MWAKQVESFFRMPFQSRWKLTDAYCEFSRWKQVITDQCLKTLQNTIFNEVELEYYLEWIVKNSILYHHLGNCWGFYTGDVYRVVPSSRAIIACIYETKYLLFTKYIRWHIENVINMFQRYTYPKGKTFWCGMTWSILSSNSETLKPFCHNTPNKPR